MENQYKVNDCAIWNAKYSLVLYFKIKNLKKKKNEKKNTKKKPKKKKNKRKNNEE